MIPGWVAPKQLNVQRGKVAEVKGKSNLWEKKDYQKMRNYFMARDK